MSFRNRLGRMGMVLAVSAVTVFMAGGCKVPNNPKETRLPEALVGHWRGSLDFHFPGFDEEKARLTFSAVIESDGTLTYWDEIGVDCVGRLKSYDADGFASHALDCKRSRNGFKGKLEFSLKLKAGEKLSDDAPFLVTVESNQLKAADPRNSSLDARIQKTPRVTFGDREAYAGKQFMLVFQEMTADSNRHDQRSILFLEMKKDGTLVVGSGSGLDRGDLSWFRPYETGSWSLDEDELTLVVYEEVREDRFTFSAGPEHRVVVNLAAIRDLNPYFYSDYRHRYPKELPVFVKVPSVELDGRAQKNPRFITANFEENGYPESP